MAWPEAWEPKTGWPKTWLMERKDQMPVNMLRKDIPKGQKPPGWASDGEQEAKLSLEDKQKEADLAVREQQALWESEEIGIVRWSGEEGQRFSDPD